MALRHQFLRAGHERHRHVVLWKREGYSDVHRQPPWPRILTFGDGAAALVLDREPMDDGFTRSEGAVHHGVAPVDAPEVRLDPCFRQPRKDRFTIREHHDPRGDPVDHWHPMRDKDHRAPPEHFADHLVTLRSEALVANRDDLIENEDIRPD